MTSSKEPSIVILNESKSGSSGRDIRWHDKKLPSSMIKLKSKEGLTILNRSKVKSSIIDYHCDQRNRTYCGPQSIAICVNYLQLGSSILQGNRKTTKQTKAIASLGNTLDYDSIVDENDIRYHPDAKQWLDGIEQRGVSLELLRKACLSLNLYADMYSAGEKPHTQVSVNGLPLTTATCDNGGKAAAYLKDPDDLRELIVNVLNHNDECLIVNYFMGALGYPGLLGHFSPIGAYDATSDLCLVLDVWPDTPAAWVKVEKLFEAMATKDSLTEKSRGCIHIQR